MPRFGIATADDPHQRGWVRTDRDVLVDLAGRLDRLQERTGAPITARRLWLQAWLDSYNDYRPLVVGVDDEVGELSAVILLATTSKAGVTRVVAMGHRSSDVVTASSVDDRSAELLAALIDDHLASIRPWRLVLRHVHPEDPVVGRLATSLSRARLVPGDISPVLSADRGPQLSSYVSGNHRRGVSGQRNRIVRAGLDLDIQHLTEPLDLRAELAEVERVHRLRDDHVGRVSAMDRPSGQRFFRQLLSTLGTRGQVCLTTLKLDGALAAYVLCFVDGTDYRMWNTRFDPAFDRFSPGKLAIYESVAHALRAGASTYDFMRGEERYKASYANESLQAVELLAGSNLVFSLADRGHLIARAQVREMDEAGGVGGRLVDRLRGARSRLRG